MKTKTKTDQQQLRSLLKKEGAIGKAVAALIRGLEARRSFNQNGKTICEPDSATQVRAALGLLEWSASPPPKSKDEPPPPGPKLSEAEKDAEIARALGVE